MAAISAALLPKGISSKNHHCFQCCSHHQRARNAILCAAGKQPSSETAALQFAAEWTPQPSSAFPWRHPMSLTMTAITIFEAAALVGAVVGGILARKRRQQLADTNIKLRMINQELRRQREQAAPDDDFRNYRTALERSLDAPSAAHPVEAYGTLQVSLARARRQVDQSIRDAKRQLHDDSVPRSQAAAAVLPLLTEALQTAKDIKDLRAERAVVRLRARAYRCMGNLSASLVALERVLELTGAVGEIGDADTLGEIGDVYAEMGDFEAAARYYDRTIEAMITPPLGDNGGGDGGNNSNSSSGGSGGSTTWDAA